MYRKHNQKLCKLCRSPIERELIGSYMVYYCQNCGFTTYEQKIGSEKTIKAK
ncbi:conserved hypothetical protein [Methanohalobium evestigatum Z-7303]|uniref:Uncharacterized protein n=1 Tax=Methanohalobium evestigatum (strain ATCC BAA-1072 / DSM 3721 / NBRC 107634 / OCM 161 / Z-7303) TaxID=644295 RepID=D7E8E8_METEZ|nr:hypothetical protein [Methanohalobium evestigatum]ADI73490.1 conserved hypothetical protein [Methanohalobium evestigatum Z-7303]